MQRRTASLVTMGATAVMAIAVLNACNDEITGLGPPSDPATETFAPSLGVNLAAMTKLPSGVYVQEITVPADGEDVLETTDSVRVNYAGYLTDGDLFESGTGIVFFMPNLIPGFRIGITGMREGGSRKLVIPSELGYGPQGVRELDGTVTVPRQSTLIFDVTIVKVFNPPPPTAPEG